jgi:hypothetical protein
VAALLVAHETIGLPVFLWALVPTFIRDVPPLSIRGSLHSLRLRLVDEPEGRMVTWAEWRALQSK